VRRYHQATKLGDGSFGSVRIVYDEHGKEWALKVFENNDDDGTMDLGAIREISVLNRIIKIRGGKAHPHIMKIHEVFVGEEDVDFNLCMVMPKYTTTLGKAIIGSYLKRKQKLRISKGLLKAVAFLHSHLIMHRDIKPDNILLSDKLSPVLADFSLAKLATISQGPTHTGDVGSAGYIAPEVYEGKGFYDHKCDVWSCGVVILETLHKPLTVDRDKAAIAQINKRRSRMGTKPVHMLLRGLLHPNPQKRLECKDAVVMEVFDELKKKPAKLMGKENQAATPKPADPSGLSKHPKMAKGTQTRQGISSETQATQARRDVNEGFGQSPNAHGNSSKASNTTHAATNKTKAPAKTTSYDVKHNDVDGKEKKKAFSEIERICSVLDFTNPLTKTAALRLWESTDQIVAYCVILAHKVFEHELMNIEEVEEYIEDFDIDEYTAAEEAMFEDMAYDLTLV